MEPWPRPPSPEVNEGPRTNVPPALERLAAYSWRLLVIAAAAWVVAWGLWELRLVVFPLGGAALLTVVLAPPARWLRRHRFPAAAAAWAVMTSFLAAMALLVWLVAPAVADELSEVSATVDDSVDDVENWLVEESPFDVDRADVERFRREARDWVTGGLVRSPGVAIGHAVVAAEVLAGVILALVVVFFLLKDGERLQRWALAQLPARRRLLAARLGRRARQTLAGYLRGSALLGIVEAVVIGGTVAVVGGHLVVPIMLMTFLAAFVPFLGAVIAGMVAVLVTLASTGLVPGLVVAGVALVVQQLDNDVLAPLVFGHTLSLHPLVVLLSLAAGAALLGAAGAILAVPVVALAVNLAAELRRTVQAGQPG